MKKQVRYLNVRTALSFSVVISLMMNIIFVLAFFYGRENMMPDKSIAERPEFSHLSTFLHMGMNFVLAFVLYLCNFSLLKSNIKNPYKTILIILTTLVVTLILSRFLSHLQIHLRAVEHPGRFIRGSMGRDLFISIIVLFSSYLLFLNYKQQKTALENERLLAENMQTRYLALKSQVDPHFLFNSLNTLNSLIKTDIDKAQDYVQELSSVFRYTLQHKEITSLSEELKFTEAYCKLMRIRYGDNLQIKMDIDESEKHWLVMPLSLQTLVENAIKHNVISDKYPFVISISTHPQRHAISVVNPIHPKQNDDKGSGIGLANLSERYLLMTKKEIEISSFEKMFRVEVPLIDPQNYKI